MPAFPLRPSRLILCLAASAVLAGCSSFDRASQGVAGMLTPYRVQVVQGNFVSREQAQALKPGLTRQQVRETLGTPLVSSVFHADRWDYVFALRRPGNDMRSHRVTVFFHGDVLARVETDGELPTEAEFVASFDAKRSNKPIPPLEATEEQLRRFPAPAASATAAPPAPASTNYPPLESPAR